MAVPRENGKESRMIPTLFWRKELIGDNAVAEPV